MPAIAIDLSKLITAEAKAAAAQTAQVAAFEAAIQAHVDATARSRAYADGNALAGYINSTVPQWSAEAAAFVAWRDQVWVYAYGELAKVQAGERAPPENPAAFVAELPGGPWS